MIVGSTVGGFIPLIWGGGAFSFAGFITSGIGAVAGIYYGYKLSKRL